MNEELQDLVRRMFVSLTVLAERASEDAIEGQAPSIDTETAQRLANRLSDAAQISGVLSEAVHALTSGPTVA